MVESFVAKLESNGALCHQCGQDVFHLVAKFHSYLHAEVGHINTRTLDCFNNLYDTYKIADEAGIYLHEDMGRSLKGKMLRGTMSPQDVVDNLKLLMVKHPKLDKGYKE